MTSKFDLSLCVAMTPDRVIGRDNALPWTLPSDMARFRKITTEIGTIVMGRKTYQSILLRNKKRPLPDRHHIVLTQDGASLAKHDSLECVESLGEAFEVITKRGGRACIIGGEQIFRLFLPFVNNAYITMVQASIPGDAYFPEELSPPKWRRTSFLNTFDERNEYRLSFLEFERIR